MFSVCVTGHRPKKLFGYDIHGEAYDGIRRELYNCLEKLVADSGETELVAYSGMALGIDQIFVEEVLRYNENHKYKFKLIAAVPHRGQEAVWRDKSSQDYYHYLLEQCDKIVYVCKPPFAGWKMQRRNKYMVDNVDHVIAVWDGTHGGTRNCVEYAITQEKDVIVIHPRTLKHRRSSY